MQWFGNKDTPEEPVFITGWSFYHFTTGIFTGFLIFYLMEKTKRPYLYSFLLGNLIHFIYELITVHPVLKKYISPELVLFTEEERELDAGSSWQNSIGDQILFAFGLILTLMVIYKTGIRIVNLKWFFIVLLTFCPGSLLLWMYMTEDKKID